MNQFWWIISLITFFLVVLIGNIILNSEEGLPNFKDMKIIKAISSSFGEDGNEVDNLFQECLDEAKKERQKICEQMSKEINELGNCPGFDFVDDPVEKCFDEYG